MEENYKVLLEQIGEKIYLDNVLINRLGEVSKKLFDILDYKLINDVNDYCEIQKFTRYNGYSVDYNNRLLVKESKFDAMKKELFLFCATSFHRENPNGIKDFSSMFKLLNYSGYLRKQGIYHYIKSIDGIVPTICLSSDKFSLEMLEKQYYDMEEQKVKRLVK